MKIKQLIKNIPQIELKGNRDIEITTIASHSQRVAPGALFVARKGARYDGNQFIPEAIAHGAVAIVSDVFDPSIRDVAQLITPDVAKAESLLAAAFWQYPSQELEIVGITGTSGKTTTSFIVHHLFSHFGVSSGLIGTVAYITGNRQCEAPYTTPDAITMQRLLRDIVKSGSTACVMEVSSHALAQGRVGNIAFDTAIFTNLSHEHLDFHKTMDEYASAKNILFQSLRTPESVAIVNAQDPWTLTVSKGCTGQLFTFAIEERADVVASEVVTHRQHTTFTLTFRGKSVPVMLPLVGRFNVANALAAAAAFLARGIYSLEDVAAGLATVTAPPGRLEIVSNARDLAIYVDYAHKVDALRKVLPVVRECTKGRLIAIFGCGGDRDREKRPLMAKACEDLADFTIVTSDNPRSEDPLAIIKEITQGFTQSRYAVVPDRREAIQLAISMAEKDDCVLIAGKGHEKYQIFATSTVPFDDCQVARECAVQLKRGAITS